MQFFQSLNIPNLISQIFSFQFLSFPLLSSIFVFFVILLLFLLSFYFISNHLFCSSSVIKGGCNLFILFKPHYLIVFPKNNLYFTLCEDCFNQELRLFDSIEDYKEFLEDIDPNAKLYRCFFLRKTAI